MELEEKRARRVLAACRVRRGAPHLSRRHWAVAGRVSSPKITEWELWACAQHYVIQHGEDAPIQVAMRADELLAEGDIAGARTFTAIVRRIERLLAPPEGTRH